MGLIHWVLVMSSSWVRFEPTVVLSWELGSVVSKTLVQNAEMITSLKYNGFCVAFLSTCGHHAYGEKSTYSVGYMGSTSALQYARILNREPLTPS